LYCSDPSGKLLLIVQHQRQFLVGRGTSVGNPDAPATTVTAAGGERRFLKLETQGGFFGAFKVTPGQRGLF